MYIILQVSFPTNPLLLQVNKKIIEKNALNSNRQEKKKTKIQSRFLVITQYYLKSHSLLGIRFFWHFVEDLKWQYEMWLCLCRSSKIESTLILITFSGLHQHIDLQKNAVCKTNSEYSTIIWEGLPNRGSSRGFGDNWWNLFHTKMQFRWRY